MKTEGTASIKAPPEKVFALIVNPQAFSKCLPDVQSLNVESPEKFTARVKTGVSFLKQTFDFQFIITDKRVPTHARMIGHGKAPGSAVDLDAYFDLSQAEGDSTTMKWVAEAKIFGPLAGMGSRVLDGVVQKIVSDLFNCIKSQVES